MSQTINNKKLLTTSGAIILIFSVICFFTSIFLSGSLSRAEHYSLPATGGTLPIVIEKKNTIYSLSIKQELIPNSWSYVYVTVEDSSRNELYAFGSELWSETGYDGGTWKESDTDFSNKITFHQPGTYNLVFEPEVLPEHLSRVGSISARLTRLRASYIPHFAVGIFALIIALVLFELGNRTFSKLIFG